MRSKIDCSAPWDWTPGEVKTRVYTMTEKGGQYAATAYIARLQAAGEQISMTEVGAG